MAIIQKISTFFKKKNNNFFLLDTKSPKIQKFYPLILISFLLIFSGLFFISLNIINKKNELNRNNLEEISKSNEFLNLSNFLISKINSPYREINYVIKNNDTVEKILKNFKIRNQDIKIISTQLKEKKLANIYSGRKLSLIIKKLGDGTNTLVNFIYPINNTSSVEVRKYKNSFLVKENILQLYKREVVVRTPISTAFHSLYAIQTS